VESLIDFIQSILKWTTIQYNSRATF
jgi:hypothetical protein